MTLRRLPIRPRLTLVFAAAMAVLLAGIGIALYEVMSAALLDEVDTGLRSRAATIQADGARAARVRTTPGGLVESREALVQIAGVRGGLMASSLAGPAVLPPAVLASVTRPAFYERRVAGIADVTRLLAVPGGAGTVIIVGASLQDRADTLGELTLVLGVAEPLALLIASFAGWLVAGSALRPVESMRLQASAISASGLDRRLTVPPADDEIARLGRTLNAMLDRLSDSFEGERRFLDMASHELRTPLTALKVELDLALARPRSHEEATAALVSAAEETNRLASLADDLLVLSRAHQGRLPIHRARVSLKELTGATTRTFAARAAALGVTLAAEVPDVPLFADEMRLRQAIDNIVDNAIRHTPAGGQVRIGAEAGGGVARIVVDDDGPGLPPGFRADHAALFTAGTGLGLAIAHAVAAGHHGNMTVENRPGGGARVTLVISTRA